MQAKNVCIEGTAEEILYVQKQRKEVKDKAFSLTYYDMFVCFIYISIYLYIFLYPCSPPIELFQLKFIFKKVTRSTQNILNGIVPIISCFYYTRISLAISTAESY